MRTSILVMVMAAAVLAGAGLASAQKKNEAAPKLGNYEAKFEEMANNCRDTGMNITKGTVKFEDKKGKLLVTVPMTSSMWGRIDKSGRFQVKADLGGTGIAGVQGKFRASGRIDDGVLQMVFIAEYYKGKKPLCTKSWNVSGVHSDKL